MPAPTKQEIKDLFAVHTSPQAKSERLQRSYHLDSTRSWVSPDGYRLSDRVWKQRAQVRAQIDKILREAIARGDDATETARRLEDFLVADLKPVRGIAGDLMPVQRKGVLTRTPRGGSGSFSARRLVRTEVSRAHFEATRFAASRTPFVLGMKWNLSSAHAEADQCDIYADQDNGLGRGVYRINDFPQMPQHPCCTCYCTTETEPDIDKIVASLRTKYNLGDGADG